MQNKANLIKRDQFAIHLFVRQLALLVKSWKKDDWGPRKLRIEDPAVEGLDDHSEEHDLENGDRVIRWQVKRQSTPLQDIHLFPIFTALKANTNLIAKIAIRDLVSVIDKEKKDIGELRVLRDLCISVAQPGVNSTAVYDGSTVAQKAWIDYASQYLGTAHETVVALGRLQIEVTGGEEDIKTKGIEYLAEFYVSPTDVWNALYTFVNEKIDSVVEYDFTVLSNNVLNKHACKSTANSLDEKLSIRTLPAGKITISSSENTSELLVRAWGLPEVCNLVSRNKVRIKYSGRFSESPSLSRALLRLSIHGGASKVFISDVNEWRDGARSIIGECFGVAPPGIEIWKDTGPSSVIDAISNRREPNTELAPTEHFSDQFSSEVTKLMNDWSWKHLQCLVEEELHIGNSQIGLSINSEFRAELYQLWLLWKNKLDEDVLVRDQYMYSMLTTVYEVGSRPHAREIRLGPLTIRKCLLEGVIFALAFTSALELESEVGSFSPGEGNIQFNNSSSQKKCHLLGLEWVERKKIYLSLNNFLSAEVHLPLITHCGDDVIERVQALSGASVSFKSLNSNAGSFKIPDILPDSPLPCGESFRASLPHGKTALKQHLGQLLKKAAQQQVDNVKNTVAASAPGGQS